MGKHAGDPGILFRANREPARPELMFNYQVIWGPTLDSWTSRGQLLHGSKDQSTAETPRLPSTTPLWGRAGLGEGSEGDRWRLELSGRLCYLGMFQTVLLHLPQRSADEREHQTPGIRSTFYANLPCEFSNPTNGVMISRTKDGYPSHPLWSMAWP